MMLRDAAMFNLVSLIIGFVALIFAVIAFIPFLGWADWLDLPAGDYRRGRRHDLARQLPAATSTYS